MAGASTYTAAFSSIIRPVLMQRTRTFLAFLLLAAAMFAPARAQDTVIQTENVRTEYARVLRAEPVYQTLRATSMVQRCEPAVLAPSAHRDPPRQGMSRIVGAVKDALTPGGDARQADARDRSGEDCRVIPVDREFRRPIAYDVDYVHHGVKYRSRLPYDPGNRLRVRVSITPIVVPAEAR